VTWEEADEYGWIFTDVQPIRFGSGYPVINSPTGEEAWICTRVDSSTRVHHNNEWHFKIWIDLRSVTPVVAVHRHRIAYAYSQSVAEKQQKQNAKKTLLQGLFAPSSSSSSSSAAAAVLSAVPTKPFEFVSRPLPLPPPPRPLLLPPPPPPPPVLPPSVLAPVPSVLKWALINFNENRRLHGKPELEATEEELRDAYTKGVDNGLMGKFVAYAKNHTKFASRFVLRNRDGLDDASWLPSKTFMPLPTPVDDDDDTKTPVFATATDEDVKMHAAEANLTKPLQNAYAYFTSEYSNLYDEQLFSVKRAKALIFDGAAANNNAESAFIIFWNKYKTKSSS
jgi:hypothetical protein